MGLSLDTALLVGLNDHDREAATELLYARGYRVCACQTADDVGAALCDGPSALLVVDPQTPELDAYALCLQIRQSPDSPLRNCPIVLLSAVWTTSWVRATWPDLAPVACCASPLETETLWRAICDAQISADTSPVLLMLTADSDLTDAPTATPTNTRLCRASGDDTAAWPQGDVQMVLIDGRGRRDLETVARQARNRWPDAGIVVQAQTGDRLGWWLAELGILRSDSDDIDTLWMVCREAWRHRALTNMERTATRTRMQALADADRFRRYVQDAPYGLLVADATGRYVDVNDASCTISGYTREQLLSMSIADLLPPSAVEAARSHFDTVKREGSADGVIPFIHASGETRLWSVKAVRLSPDRHLAFVQDVTERHAVETRLITSEAKYRAVVNNTHEAVYVAQNGVIVFANPVCAAMSGYDLNELIGMRIDALVCDEDRQRVVQTHWDRMQGTAGDGVGRASVRTKQGERRLVEYHASIIEWEGARATLNLLLDISEREQALETLRSREALLSRIFEILPVGLWIADRTGKLIRTNAAGRAIWGAEPHVGPDEYGVFSARRLPSGEPVAPDDWALAHSLTEGVTVVDELLEIDGFDGVKRIILNYTAPVFNDAGDIEAAIIVNQDVTSRIEAERARERLQEQLIQAHKMESVGRLAGGVAHDYNNMLQAIIGYQEVAKQSAVPGSQQYDALVEIGKAAQRSSEITRQLLSFARQQHQDPRIVDVNDLVTDNARLLGRLVGEHISYRIITCGGAPCVNIDPTQFEQVLTNLVVNARDAIDAAGTITVSTSCVTLTEDEVSPWPGAAPGEYVRLTVSDTGRGIAPESLKHLFEPFYTTKGVGEGTGLGLSIVYGIVCQNHGVIQVESAMGTGSAFHINLPRCACDAVTQQPTLPDAAPHRHAGTVLLVEDEQAILKLVKRVLAEQGHTVLSAPTPDAALALLQTVDSPVDLLITDIIMPGMNGIDLAQMVTRTHPETRCLFMSGYATEVVAQYGVDMGNARVLQKPFTVRTLLDAVRDALN